MLTAVPAPPEALTIPEVMRALRLSRSKVYDLIGSRQLASFTVGRAARAPRRPARLHSRTEEEPERRRQHLAAQGRALRGTRLRPSARRHPQTQDSRLYLVPLLGNRRLESLTTANVRRMLSAVTAQASAATAKEAHRVLRTALTAACWEELISRNVAQIVPAPQVEPRELCPWSMDESLTFLEAARSDSLYPAFVLAVALGLRRGEILGLHWRDVGLDRRTLTVRTTLNRGGKELYLDSTKNRRARVVPLPIMCVAPLRWQRMRQAAQRAALGAEWHDSGLVFTTRSGLSIEPRNLYRSFQRGVSVSGSAAGPSARHPARVRIPAVRGWRRAPHRHGDPGALSDCGHHERLHARQR